MSHSAWALRSLSCLYLFLQQCLGLGRAACHRRLEWQNDPISRSAIASFECCWPAYACPLNDHSGSKGVGLPSAPKGQSMSIVASIVARIMSRLFSARFRPMQILHPWSVVSIRMSGPGFQVANMLTASQTQSCPLAAAPHSRPDLLADTSRARSGRAPRRRTRRGTWPRHSDRRWCPWG